MMFPLVLLQAKVVGVCTSSSFQWKLSDSVSISSPSSEGGGLFEILTAKRYKLCFH